MICNFPLGKHFTTKMKHSDRTINKSLSTRLVIHSRPQMAFYVINQDLPPPLMNRKKAQKGNIALTFLPLSSSCGRFLASQARKPDLILSVWNWREERRIASSPSDKAEAYQIHFSQLDHRKITICGPNHITFWTLEGAPASGMGGLFSRDGRFMLTPSAKWRMQHIENDICHKVSFFQYFFDCGPRRVGKGREWDGLGQSPDLAE